MFYTIISFVQLNKVTIGGLHPHKFSTEPTNEIVYSILSLYSYVFMHVM